MNPCPRCNAPTSTSGRFCPECGAALGTSTDDVTRPIDAATPRTPTSATPPSFTSPSSRGLDSPALDGGRFPAGVVLGDRYRIVGHLGRGGMGEVYRADDLKLGASVALKLLPPEFAANRVWLDRFYAEVRLARQVAHPNVCRVYDVVEIGEQTFLSMEYVDGENFSGLLKQIGRFPHERGLEIARQLCAGLAALHDRGLIHRDLKPANVMLDGRGRVRITDFGLAGGIEELQQSTERVGTPAYMAPEQLESGKTTVQSDIFALGLVLYEIFTGKRAVAGQTLPEITRHHRDGSVSAPSTMVANFDPAIERVLLRCLSRDPARRPASALAVAAALPGGDPLAAALAAGETPSPEMVALAGKQGGIRRGVGVLCAVAVLLALSVQFRFGQSSEPERHFHLEKPPAVLLDRARTLLDRFDAPEAVDFAHSFHRNGEFIEHVAQSDSTADKWRRLRDDRPSGMLYWYRQSPSPLLPFGLRGTVDFEDPPMRSAGMANLRLDSQGRMLFLQVVPPQVIPRSGPASAPRDSLPSAESIWDLAFTEAGLDRARFTEIAPVWNPPLYADRVAAWSGTWDQSDTARVRVDAAVYDGRLVWFDAVGASRRPDRELQAPATPTDRAIQYMFFVLSISVMGGGIFLGVRNVRLGRSDRRGAWRLALFVFAGFDLLWLLGAKHFSDPNVELQRFLLASAVALLNAAVFFAFYLALEPYVRRTNPERIVSWARLLRGGFRDPLVGRDILIGGVFFFTMSVALLAQRLFEDANGAAGSAARFSVDALLGTGPTLAVILAQLLNTIFMGLFALVLLVLLRILLRNEWLARIGFCVFIVAIATFEASSKTVGLLGGAFFAVCSITVLVRFGVLPFLIGLFFRRVAMELPLTLDGGAWYFGATGLASTLILGLSLYGLWIALRGRASADDEFAES